MLNVDFLKFQLSRDQMRTIKAGHELTNPDGECKSRKCELNGSEAPCMEFDAQAGSWFCSWCCTSN